MSVIEDFTVADTMPKRLRGTRHAVSPYKDLFDRALEISPKYLVKEFPSNYGIMKLRNKLHNAAKRMAVEDSRYASLKFHVRGRAVYIHAVSGDTE